MNRHEKSQSPVFKQRRGFFVQKTPMIFFLFVIFTLLGSVLFFWGVKEGLSSLHLLRSAQKAEGKVVGFRESLSESPDRDPQKETLSYFPKVEFVSDHGGVQKFEGQTGSNPPAYSVGEKVVVLYSSAQVKIKNWEELWLRSTALMGVGFVLLLGMGGVYWFSRNRPASALFIQEPSLTFRQTSETPSFQYPEMNEAFKKELEVLLRRGDKIEAIRRVKEKTGLDLKTSKERVEELEKRL